MAFYHFLAIFPSLILFFTVTAHIPHLGRSLMKVFQDLGRQVLPDRVSQLFQQRTSEFSGHPGSGLPLVSICLAALWAAHNGTWAMIYGLNRAYEVEEKRSWREMTVTNIALTLFLSVSAFLTLFLIFCGAWLQSRFHGGAMALRTLEWLVLTVVLSACFAVLYRFAPNLPDHAWRWSTPGALCALILWMGATVGARLDFDHVSSYARTYGQLDGVAMLLLWLYITNGAILIGGEMNSEIEKNISRSRSAHPPHSVPIPDAEVQ